MQQNQTDIIAALRSSLSTYRDLAIEANDRVAGFKAERDIFDAKNKALQAELDALKVEKAKVPEEPTAE